MNYLFNRPAFTVLLVIEMSMKLHHDVCVVFCQYSQETHINRASAGHTHFCQ